MSVGVQKEINCPVVQNCSWKGNIMESFTHCTRQHPNCVLHPRACKVNLTQGIDERKILKLSNDQLLTLHVVCGKEIGVSVINLAAEGSKQGSYNITLKSLDGCCETIVRNIEILGHNEPKTSRSIPQLNFVEMLLEFYVKEANDNGFIYGCRNDRLANNLNVSIDYGLVNTDYIYNCPHGIYGCNFLGKVETMKVHQRGCKLFKCFVKTCEWIGIQDNVYNHIRDKHAVSKNCITLDVNDLMDDNVFFFKTNHGLIFVHIKMDPKHGCYKRKLLLPLWTTTTSENIIWK